MAINVADNFSYKGSKPLDARIKANTVSDLVSTPAADLYDGCFAYVTGTKKYYSYDSTNTSDPTLGKWREFQQGGGGGGSLPSGGTTGQSLVKHSNTDEDVEWFDVNKEISFDDFNNLSQAEKDNGTSYYIPDATVVSGITVRGRFMSTIYKNGTYYGQGEQPMPAEDIDEVISPLPSVMSRKMKYSTSEQIIGEWIDGKPLYQKTIDLGNLPNATTKQVNTEISNAKRLINYSATATDSNGGNIAFPRLWLGGSGDMYIGFGSNLSTINVATTSDRSGMTGYCTVQYTKTTD